MGKMRERTHAGEAWVEGREVEALPVRPSSPPPGFEETSGAPSHSGPSPGGLTFPDRNYFRDMAISAPTSPIESKS